ncbi:phosphotransferase [Rhizobium aegyptiacum]|uniref:phosphotransferase n=1 Tax=Rhizobium aegyptiacum TaxID=1764550 RepID=UPI0007E5953D|nr:phosphotransferase [Rhizobium aegyptiacum]
MSWRQVVWFGPRPSEAVFDAFSFLCRPIRWIEDQNEALDPRFVGGAVFHLEQHSFDLVKNAAEEYVMMLVDYGIPVVFTAESDALMGSAQAAIAEILGLPQVIRLTQPTPENLARRMASAELDMPPRLGLEITVAYNRRPLEPGERRLFQRAFSTCSSVALVELTGGRSDARVFAVHMTTDGSDAGVWPQPAFAKLDLPKKIRKEAENYLKYAEPFIPFGLRPNIKGTYDGAEKSLLVGNFVASSESLWAMARRDGGAEEAINSLLDDTLLSWRNQAYSRVPEEGSIPVALRQCGVFDPDKLCKSYVKHAESIGLKSSFSKIWERLEALRQPYRTCPIHGDLHGDNVRVRKGQSILIDLATVQPKGPAVSDLASLEVWLAFELPPDSETNCFKDDAWTSEIDRLFAPASFQHPPGPVDPLSKYTWTANVVRQIRGKGIASQTSSKEYQVAVAIQLLRRCQWEGENDADRYRRCYAYMTALKLILDIVEG